MVPSYATGNEIDIRLISLGNVSASPTRAGAACRGAPASTLDPNLI